MKEKFKWSGSVTAPKEYPAEIFRGIISSEDYDFDFNSMWGTTNGGWGNIGKLMSSDFHEVPNYIDMTWLSIVEKKFYSYQGNLPKEKIRELLLKGYLYNGIKDTFDKIIIGLAPNGFLVVWLAGVNQVEIVQFQAKVVEIDKTQVHDNEVYMFKDDFVESILNNEMIISSNILQKINTDGYPPFEIYNKYREKYFWKPKIYLPKNTTLISLIIKMCNGEIEYCEKDELFFKDDRAIPYSFEIIWKDSTNQEFISRIALTKDNKYWSNYLLSGDQSLPLDFDKNEITSIFKNLYKNQLCELVIKIDDVQEETKWITHFYIEQSQKQYNIKTINQDSGKY